MSTFATQTDNAGNVVAFDKWDKICANRVETTGSLSDLYAVAAVLTIVAVVVCIFTCISTLL